MPWPEYVFSRLLIITKLYPTAADSQQVLWRAESDEILNKLRIWSDNCSDNFEHKYFLAAAELARIDGRSIEAIQLYDKAIEAARLGNFLQWEGMANERAYHFWSALGHDHFAFIYWKQAYVCYKQWGANSKINAMEKIYRTYLLKNIPAGNVTNKQDDKQEKEIRNEFIESQILQLRNFAFEIQQSKINIKTAQQADELAHAMQHLRVEISERKRTEEALRESEKRFHSLFENMGEGVALHELEFEDGKPVNYRIIDVNKSFEKIIGARHLKVAGKLSTDAYHVTSPPYLEEYSKVAINKRVIYFETHFASLDKYFAISVAPWRENGFATIFSDITERMIAEAEINLKNEQLIKLNAEKDKFFSIIAHDLRGPLSTFLGLTEIMAKELPRLTMAEIQKIAERMMNSASSLYGLLENLLQWSQIRQGLIPFRPEELNLLSVFTDTIAMVMESAQKKKIKFTFDIRKDIIVFADKNILQTIIRNLVSNAIKFTPGGGKIKLSATIGADRSVEIAVSDSGIGMSQEIIENLFRIGLQTNRIGTDNEPSTGLGLLLCKEFVEKHKGQIRVESLEGKGSTFYFNLPCKAE